MLYSVFCDILFSISAIVSRKISSKMCLKESVLKILSVLYTCSGTVELTINNQFRIKSVYVCHVCILCMYTKLVDHQFHALKQRQYYDFLSLMGEGITTVNIEWRETLKLTIK